MLKDKGNKKSQHFHSDCGKMKFVKCNCAQGRVLFVCFWKFIGVSQ